MDINKIAKQFCDNTTVAFTPEFFVIAMMTGESGTVYAFTPEHAKRFALSIAHSVAEYEKQNGEIKAEWSPNVTSPIQPHDMQ